MPMEDDMKDGWKVPWVKRKGEMGERWVKGRVPRVRGQMGEGYHV